MFKTVSSLFGWMGNLGRSALRQAGGPMATRLPPMPPRVPGALSQALSQAPADAPPLGARQLAKAASLEPRANHDLAAVKPPVEIRFFTRSGVEALVRRPTPKDLAPMEAFLERCAPDNEAGDEGTAPGPASATVQAWMASNPRHDAFIAVVDGRVVGCATLDPHPRHTQTPQEAAVLKDEGLEASEVCVSQLLVDPELRGHGIGKALKQAQARGAGDAGYRAVIGETRSPRVMALAERLGGVVAPQEALTRYTVLRTEVDRKDG
ncbi:GNAT family N-acetyltransferase [Ramlibacter sp. MAHUQ-53]|uniref:GNAT family N-acetyltransferase n=1 Tax=unclassified Ramlibacter TaxID=2617605 RepID=UPI0036347669